MGEVASPGQSDRAAANQTSAPVTFLSATSTADNRCLARYSSNRSFLAVYVVGERCARRDCWRAKCKERQAGVVRSTPFYVQNRPSCAILASIEVLAVAEALLGKPLSTCRTSGRASLRLANTRSPFGRLREENADGRFNLA